MNDTTQKLLYDDLNDLVARPDEWNHTALSEVAGRALKALRDANGWRPIETAPKDASVSILTFPHYRVTSWSDDLGAFWRWSEYHDEERALEPQPTHWMPLPDPPADPEPETEPSP